MLEATDSALICAALQYYALHCGKRAADMAQTDPHLTNQIAAEYNCADRSRALRSRILHDDRFWPEGDEA